MRDSGMNHDGTNLNTFDRDETSWRREFLNDVLKVIVYKRKSWKIFLYFSYFFSVFELRGHRMIRNDSE